MNIGVVVLWAILVMLVLVALKRGDNTLGRGAQRAVEQFAKLGPRMICALIAAGFIAKLIPAAAISRFLGEEAGFQAVVVGAFAGLLVPSGPVIAFSVATVFARADASVPALIAFLTSWSLFAAHRIFIYELPLLGPSFLRTRAASVVALPFLAGAIAIAAGTLVTVTTLGHS